MFFGKSSYSQQDLDTYESFGSLNHTGCDMTFYHEELQQHRNFRTFSMRQFGTSGHYHGVKSLKLSTPILNTPMTTIFDPSTIIPLLKDPPTIKSQPIEIENFKNFLTNLYKTTLKTPRVVKLFLSSPEVIDSFTNIINLELPPVVSICYLQTLTSIFPHCEPNQSLFVDNVFLYFNEMLECKNPETVMGVLSLISTICNYSSYGRDAILSNETHITISNLMQMIISRDPDAVIYENQMNIDRVVDLAADTLYHIFANPEKVELPEILSSYLPNIITILQMINPQETSSINSLLLTLVEITNKNPLLSSTIYKAELFPSLIEMMKNDEKRSPALSLIGNCCCGPFHSHITALLGLGLTDILFQLFQTELASDSFWVLSNLLLALPNEILPIVTKADFIAGIIKTASAAPYELKKEVSFLLSLIIIFLKLDSIEPMMTSEIFDILTDMINYNEENVCLSGFDTISKFVLLAVQNGNEMCERFSEIANETDLLITLSTIIESKTNVSLKEKAEVLYNRILKLQKSLQV